MPFFLLQIDTQGTSLEPDPPAGSVRAMVVIAPDEEVARTTASENCGTEGDLVWTKPAETTCREVEDGGGTSMLLRAFNE